MLIVDCNGADRVYGLAKPGSRPWDRVAKPALAVALVAAGAGCQAHPAPGLGSVRRPTVEIYYPRQTWRCRIPDDCPLPSGVAVPLCDEYRVLEVRNAHTWRAVRRTLHLRRVTEELDFGQGMVVGLAGVLGRPLSGQWPIRIDHLKQSGGLGSLTVRIEEGLYNPTRGSAYCVLAYVPGLKELAIVRVNQRLFYLEQSQ